MSVSIIILYPFNKIVLFTTFTDTLLCKICLYVIFLLVPEKKAESLWEELQKAEGIVYHSKAQREIYEEQKV